jgi:hypothetical protein
MAAHVKRMAAYDHGLLSQELSTELHMCAAVVRSATLPMCIDTARRNAR